MVVITAVIISFLLTAPCVFFSTMFRAISNSHAVHNYKFINIDCSNVVLKYVLLNGLSALIFTDIQKKLSD